MRTPNATLMITAALTLVAVLAPLAVDHGAPALDTSTKVLLSGDERAGASYERMRDMLEGQSLVCVLIRDEHLLSNEGIARIKTLGDGLQALPGIGDVKSLTHSWRPVRKTGFTLDPREFIGLKPMVPLGAIPEQGWVQVRRFVESYPLARDLFISRDGSWALLMVTVERDLSESAAVAALDADVRGLLAPVDEAVDEVHVLAFPFLEAEVRSSVREDVQRFAGLAGVAAAAILLLTFRSPSILAAVMLFLAAGLASIPTMLRITGVSLNIYSAMLVPLVAGLQLTFLTHFVSAFQERAREGAAAGPAARSALRLVARPSWIAVVTSIIGLLSLRACDVGLVKEFGTLGAGAVVVVSVITFGPLMLLASRGRGDAGTASPPDGSGDAEPTGVALTLATWTGRHRRGLLLGAGALVLACVPGALDLRTDVRATEFLAPDSPGRLGLARLDEHLGGVNVFQLELECALPGGAAAPETLQFLEDFRRHAEALPGVTNVYSYALLLGLVNQLWTGDEDGEPTPPSSPMLAQLFTSGLRMLDWALLESFLDEQGEKTSVLVRTRDMPGTEYLALLNELTDFAERMCPEGITLEVPRGVHDLIEADRRIVDSQLSSLGICAVSILLAVALLWWSWRAALLTLLVNVPALAVVGGLMGWAQMPLNSITVMVSAVVLGIAVDDSIHWLGFHRQERARGADPEEAVRRTLAHKLKPMACTTGILVAGLSILSLSRFPPVADFGLLSSAALLVSLASTMLLLPVLVRRVSGRGGSEASGG